jgi:hypothetical protein
MSRLERDQPPADAVQLDLDPVAAARSKSGDDRVVARD